MHAIYLVHETYGRCGFDFITVLFSCWSLMLGCYSDCSNKSWCRKLWTDSFHIEIRFVFWAFLSTLPSHFCSFFQ